jgi:hypothetical protein
MKRARPRKNYPNPAHASLINELYRLADPVLLFTRHAQHLVQLPVVAAEPAAALAAPGPALQIVFINPTNRIYKSNKSYL